MYNSTPKLKPFLEKIVCPIGKVPIRRTTEDDLTKSKSSFNTEAEQVIPGIHVVEVYMRTKVNESYYGVSGTSSIYNPTVTSKDQSSATHAWVQNGEGGGTNKIYAGWHVDPKLHGNEGTYAYAEWTSDNFKNTGCFNLRCPGFVQTSQEMFLDARVERISAYNGVMIEMPITLTKDSETNNWWLSLDNTWVGYFPAALFSNLKSADKVGWGGRTTTTSATSIPPLGMVSPQMGSGYFPDNTFHHGSYFIHMQYQYQPGNHANAIFVPPNKDRMNWVRDNKKCFGIEYYGNVKDNGLGYSLQFGGPGGQCDA
ncbi:unnamed protein product [Lupinus luteus]|uniref:Neprosin PEP catalytic domain-containing protein n=1 Tax=Lupinus luteus TaxID=3873 RepID=A0AAV1WE65_LUPLU